MIRRDPRDISRIYVLPPKQNEYIEVPYRTLSYPAVTLWEHKQSLRYLKEQGMKKFDEDMIFRTIEAMRKITEAAAASTRAARRKKARTNHISQKTSSTENNKLLILEEAEAAIPNANVKPFANIEEW